MSVLPHEGTHPILYGTIAVPAGPRVHTGYLARPDLGGAYPSLALAADGSGLTSGIKDVCRRIARHGVAVVAPVITPGNDGLRLLRDARAYLRRPGTKWSHPDRVVVAGIGAGAEAAIAAAEGAAAAVVVSPRFGGEDPPRCAVPLLGLMVRDAPELTDGALQRLREVYPRAELVVYQNAAAGFLDVGDDSYDDAVATDAIRRIVSFVTGRRARAAAPA